MCLERLKQLLIINIFFLFLAACSTINPLTVTKIETKIDIPIQSHPSPVVTREVYFYVVNGENFENFKKRFEQENGQFVFYAISPKDYENLALNMNDIIRYLKQQKAIIVYYEKSIESTKNKKE